MKTHLVVMEGPEWSYPIKGFFKKDRAEDYQTELNDVPRKERGSSTARLSDYGVREVDIDFTGWKPEAKDINLLPKPLRRYIHDIVTNSDPAGMVRENILLKDEAVMVGKLIEELQASLENVITYAAQLHSIFSTNGGEKAIQLEDKYVNALNEAWIALNDDIADDIDNRAAKFNEEIE